MSTGHRILIKNGKLLALALAGIIVVAGYFCLPWVQQQLKIDACLDRGGRWDYAAERCSDSKPTNN
ncbi:protein of unknown function [Pseudodesulfovibrio profundus]|uniref:Uncharacterized protein n=1 Tax=Pseudodesulfovibrio profundus TaxID=57320 RepID=A0A2C8FBN2_9BACT|nr:protein of unknown function [Pseudodesulfovibrio profundus]